MHEQVKKVSQMVDMQNWLTSSPFELSGGQKQRTTLAGVLVNDVDILLFDEPLANLDPATGKTAIEIIEEICSSVNKTIIIIEHNPEIIKCADHIIDLGPEGGENGGQLLAEGTPEDVAKNKKSITAKYLKSKL